MRNGILAALAAVMVVSGCATIGRSRLNPVNWFGRSQATAVVTAEPTRDGGRVPVQQVTALFVEPTRGGAIIRATGVPPTQGWYEAQLIAEPRDNPAELVYRFVLKEPAPGTRVGTLVSREVTVATFVSDFRLEEVRRITVTGAQNARTTQRR